MQERRKFLETVKSCCNPPGGVVYVEGVWTCFWSLTVYFNNTSVRCKAGWQVWWDQDILTIHEVHQPTPGKGSFWGDLLAGAASAVLAPKHEIMWRSIDGISRN